MLWGRTVAVLSLSTLLMGSKIVITVPEGGSVVSSSGLFSCSAGEVCTIELERHYLAETFTAVPAQGYSFERWHNGNGELCRGSRDPDCPEFNTAADGAYSGFYLPGSGEETYTLRPSFSAWAAGEGEPRPRVTIRSFHSTRFFAVDGDTAAELRGQLEGSVNPLAPVSGAGRKPVGHANFSYHYRYQPEYGTDMRQCRVSAAELRFNFETVLPRLANLTDKPMELQSRWIPFREDVIAHEAGHHAINRRMVQALPDTLAAVGEVPCEELDHRIRLAVSRLEEDIRRANRDYDAARGGDEYTLSAL